MQRWLAPTLLFVVVVAVGCGRAASRDLGEPATPAADQSVSSPTATATAPPTPTLTPEPEPLTTGETRRSFWTGPLGLFPLAIELRPGSDPDTNRWRATVATIPFTCDPTPTDGGWHLDGCDGDLPEAEITLEVPRDLDGEMTVTVTDSSLTPVEVQTVTMRLVADRDEEQSHGVMLLWQTRALTGQGTSDVWVADGVVFAPNFGGYVELLSAASGDSVAVIDLSLLVGTGAPAPAVLDVKARDGVAYFATSSNGVFIYDVSLPDRPAFLANYVIPPSTAEATDGVWNIHNIYLSPDRPMLYIINQSGAVPDLRLIDVSNPSAPTEAGRFAVPGSSLDTASDGGDEHVFPHDVHVATVDGREIAYVNYWSAGVRIVDATDPAAIVELGSWSAEGINSHAGWPFEVNGRRYYAHGGEGYDQGLTILDVTDPAAPVAVGSYESRDGISVHNVEVRDGFAYVAYYIDGLRVVDLRDPTRPIEVAHFDTVNANAERALFSGAWGVRLDGERVLVSDRQSGILALQVELPSD